MELSQAQLNTLQALTINTSKVRTENLAVGQQLQAKVVSVDPQNGEVTLKINEDLITAKLNATKALLQLTAGQTLQLTVAQATANKVVLQLPAALLDAATQQNALREALPKQQPITDAIIQLKALVKLATANSVSSNPLPTSIVDFAKKFISKLPTPEQLSTASGVKQAIKQSGVFLENSLSQIAASSTKNTIENDIKSLLLGLKSILLKEKETLPNQSIPKNSQPATLGSTVKPTLPQTASTELKPTHQSNTALNAQANSNLVKQAQSASSFIAAKTISDNAALLTTKPNVQNQTQVNNTTPQIPTGSVKTIDKNTYLKIIEIRTIEADITQALKNTGNTVNTDKQLSDKQIQQILNNLLGQRKTSQVSYRPLQTAGFLAPPTNLSVAKNQAITVLNPAQQYAIKDKIIPQNELAMAAIKSQHVSEASTPRINSLIDLIETLIKQVDSAISRTQMHQLNTLQDQDSNKLALRLEIPVNDDDNLHLVQLEIEKEQNKADETETVVTVNLAIDLNEIGPVYVKITLINDRTSVVLWAERNSTFRLVEESVDILQLKLKTSGLTPDGIACHHGQPPQSHFIKTEINNGLVDERA